MLLLNLSPETAQYKVVQLGCMLCVCECVCLSCVCVINRYVGPLHNTARAWQDKSVGALCGCVCESGWLIDSLLGACSCKWESVDMPQSARKRQSINCLIHLRLSFSPSFSFVPGFPFPFELSPFLLLSLSLYTSTATSGPFSCSFCSLQLPSLLFISYYCCWW